MTEQVLAEETGAYESERTELEAEGCAGKWVVYLGKRRIGLFESPREASAAGIREAGLNSPFLLQKVGEPARPELACYSSFVPLSSRHGTS